MHDPTLAMHHALFDSGPASPIFHNSSHMNMLIISAIILVCPHAAMGRLFETASVRKSKHAEEQPHRPVGRQRGTAEPAGLRLRARR